MRTKQAKRARQSKTNSSVKKQVHAVVLVESSLKKYTEEKTRHVEQEKFLCLVRRKAGKR